MMQKSNRVNTTEYLSTKKEKNELRVEVEFKQNEFNEGTKFIKLLWHVGV